jgi:hypothetical protein
MSYIGAEQARALLGAWQEVVGWQEGGRHSNIHHGPYGGHRYRAQRRQFGYGAAIGSDPAYGPYGAPPGYMPGYPAEYGPDGYPGQVYAAVPGYPMQSYAPPDAYTAQMFAATQVMYPPPAPNYNAYGAGAGPAFSPSYGSGPALVDRQTPVRADRITLPMSSGSNVFPNASVAITARPQAVAFRPERIIIGNRPSDWIVNDVKVGNRSQFAQSGDVPGEMFAATTIDGYVSMETVQTAMDFVIVVTYVGDSQEGAPFVCGVLGTAAV